MADGIHKQGMQFRVGGDDVRLDVFGDRFVHVPLRQLRKP
jgi:hypothetical protein